MWVLTVYCITKYKVIVRKVISTAKVLKDSKARIYRWKSPIVVVIMYKFFGTTLINPLINFNTALNDTITWH